MKAVVLGGTSGMGRAIAQRLVERGDRVFLLGVGEEDLARSAADLKARHPQGLDAGTRSSTSSAPMASRRRSTQPTPRSAASTRSW